MSSYFTSWSDQSDPVIFTDSADTGDLACIQMTEGVMPKIYNRIIRIARGV